jgi:hypothetical protein
MISLMSVASAGENAKAFHLAAAGRIWRREYVAQAPLRPYVAACTSKVTVRSPYNVRTQQVHTTQESSNLLNLVISHIAFATVAFRYACTNNQR